MLSGLTACAGMLTAALAPNIWLVVAGFAVTGLGLANLFPTAMARAGILAGRPASRWPRRSATAVSCWAARDRLPSKPVGLRAGLTTLSFLAVIASGIAYLSRTANT